MAINLNFDTPQSASNRVVAVTGTVAAQSVGHLKIILNVTTGATINRSFYREIDYDNSASATSLPVNAGYTITITPKILTTETINATTGVITSWSYTEP